MSLSGSAPPQFAAPFRFDQTGQPVYVDQDSPDEIASSVLNVVSCIQGQKLNDPTFGIPSPLFGSLPVDTGGIVRAIQALEPRAEITATTGPGLVQSVGEIVGALFPSPSLLPGPDLLAGSGELEGGGLTVDPGGATVNLIASVTTDSA